MRRTAVVGLVQRRSRDHSPPRADIDVGVCCTPVLLVVVMVALSQVPAGLSPPMKAQPAQLARQLC